jgi:hypothetical protein
MPMRIYTYQPNFSQKLKKSKLRKLFTPRRILTWILRLTALGIALIAVAFLYYSKDLPDPNKLLTRNIVESTKVRFASPCTS